MRLTRDNIPKAEALVKIIADVLRLGLGRRLTTDLAAAISARLCFVVGDVALREHEVLGQLANPLCADKTLDEATVMERARNIAGLALNNLTIGREEDQPQGAART
jgi:hypothetical protein